MIGLKICFALLVAVAAVSAQAVTVLSPNGGEVFEIGDTMHIRWETTLFNVRVDISVDNGETYKTITGNNTSDEDWTNIAWVIPASVFGVSLVSQSCLIVVRSYFGIEADESDSVFTIREAQDTTTVIDPSDEKKKGGCGTGAGLALLPVLAVAGGSRWRRRMHR